MKTKGFAKKERIVSQKLIDRLFCGTGSHSLAAFPVRAVYIKKERACISEPPVQLLISVSKRHFKHAVDRNRVKRQLREAYRRHKSLLADTLPDNQQMALAFLWLANNHLPSADVESRVVSLLQRIAKKQDS